MNNYNNSSNILSYWYSQIKTKGIWSFISKAAKHLRRFLFISRLIRYATLVIAVIETSATLVLVATGFLIALPITIISLGVTAVIGMFAFRKYNPTIEKEINEAEKIVFIEAKKGFYRKKTAYLNRMALTFRNEGYTVFVVSHSFAADRFLSARKAGDHLWVIRLNYYYAIKKKFLKDIDDKLTYIY